MDLRRIYDYLIVESADPFTRGWPLIDSPFPITIISAAYMYFVLNAGPRYMKNRPPFRLRAFILLYNLFQILINAWIVKKHISAGWLTEYNLLAKCNSSNTDPTTPNGFKLVTIVWWLFLMKLIDYTETCVFVLRKKQNQVSALHVYHHVVIVFYFWYYLKYIVAPVATIVSLINCSVHVLMYTYYFAAAWSTELQQAASPIKSYITKIQITQFVAFLVILLNNILNPECKILSLQSRYILANFSVFNLLLFVYLFYDFHKKTYDKIQKNITSKQKDIKQE